MAHRLRHRGPNDSDVRVLGNVGLAHTRLSIIDLSPDGRQPMSNEDGSVWLSYNGEIYDFNDLRLRLVARGHVFRSRTDSEVLIHAYEEEGLAMLGRLNGMFAFALWDSRENRLVLARDRTGQKPLYIYEDDAVLAFASELKALRVIPGLDWTVRESAIPEFLAHGYTEGSQTFYRRVRRLEPGTFESFRGRQVDRRRFWSYPRTDPQAEDFQSATRQVRQLVDAAVARRLVSDVPIGAFLSGGVDSSIVVAAMARHTSDVRTFSLGFDGDPRFDESHYAEQVAGYVGARHTTLRVGPDSFELLPEILNIWDEPFGDASAIPTAIISRLAHGKTSVVLTGDGGDEVFAGYSRFSTVAYAEPIPGFLRRWVARSGMPPGSLRMSEKARGFLERLAPELPTRLHSWIAMFPPSELGALLKQEPHDLYPPYRDVMRDEHLEDAVNQLLRLNARTYLQEDLNPKVDRSSMATGLEARSPFLDTDLLDYVFRLPGRYKLSWLRRKWILRCAFSDLLPDWVFKRRKMGFGLPLDAWFRGPLRPFVLDHLASESSPIFEFLVFERVQSLLKEHLQSGRSLGLRLWTLLMLDHWLRRESQLRKTARLGTESPLLKAPPVTG